MHRTTFRTSNFESFKLASGRKEHVHVDIIRLALLGAGAKVDRSLGRQ